ncbi:ABC transporter permease [Knoellia sp. CPCC 206453]|uniref:ABC transporter permease n=1 Tax=Knoellia pratensis TaxID=3404796 RepID=UPI00360F5188
MIGLRDAATLARTKVRSKRIRLLITTIVSGLLFGLIGGGVLLFDGTAGSVDRFAEQNLGGRYLVQGTPVLPSEQIYPNPTDPGVHKEIETLHAAYIAERKAAAKRYDIPDYDPKSEVQPIVDDPYGDPSIPADQRRIVNTESVAWKRREAAAIEKIQRNSKSTPEKYAADSRAAGATDTYQPQSLQALGLTYLKDGREDLTGAAQADLGSKDGSQGPAGDSSIASSNFTIMDDDLVAAFIAEPNAARATPKGIPILVPIDDVVATLGKSLSVTKRPKDSSGQVAWYRNVRAKANGVTFTACYRNQAERDRVEEARSTAAEIAANKNTRGFDKPKLVLELPTTACGPVTVASDTRTAREKERAENQRAFDAMASSTVAAQTTPQEVPKAELLTFQIVGVLPTGQSGSGGLESLVSSIVGTTYGYGSIIPSGLLEKLPTALRHSQVLSHKPAATPESIMMFGPMGPEAAYISSFPTVDQAKKFIANYSCGEGGGFLGGGDYYSECGMPFSVGTYGTSYLVVDDIGREARPFLIGILGALFGVATIIIWAMMGRVIADSRRETAVFRAIGAKRGDIIKIYLLYSLWVALRIALFAAVLAGVIVLVIETLFSRRATDAAQLAYGVFNGDATFHFFGTPSWLFWAILGGILAMSLVAITPPLMRNIRRNPIRDMRDE